MPRKLDLTPVNQPARKLDLTPVNVAPTESPKAASSSFLDSVSSYIPAPVKSIWNAANTSAFDYLPSAVDPSHIARNVSSYFDPSGTDPYYSSTATNFVGDVLHSLPTPLNAATMGSYGLAGRAAARGLPMAARGLEAIGGALSLPVAAEGAYNVAAGETLPQKFAGAVQLAGGAFGAKGLKGEIPKFGEINAELRGTPKTTYEANTVPVTGEVVPKDIAPEPPRVEARGAEVQPTKNVAPEVPPEQQAILDKFGVQAAPEVAPELPPAEVTPTATTELPKGEQRVIFDTEGNQRILTPEEADNYVGQPGETYGVLKPNGTFISLNDLGGNVPDDVRIVRPRRREYPGFKGTTASEAMGMRGSNNPEIASLQNRLAGATGGKPPAPPAELLSSGDLNPDIPIIPRPTPPEFNQGMFSQIWNAPRTLQSIDLPGITSAALRQSRPLSFTSDWFKAWGQAAKAFGSKDALATINENIRNSKYFKPAYEPKYNSAGEITAYKELPSIGEKLGVKMTDVLNRREEAISSSLAERIPGYGRYVTASNRAYTGFLNDLRMNKFEQLMDGAKELGRDPEADVVLGKRIADYVNNATGRGSLKFGEKANLEPIAEVLGDALYSPRALSARLQFINPYNYTYQDPFVRKEYWKSLARIVGSWGAFTSLGAIAGGSTSFDPTNADFGKIRFGNTRIDPGAGFQQLLVLGARESPQFMGGGGTTASTTGKFSPFGAKFTSATRLSTAGRYLYNQLNPSLRFAFDLASASRSEPFDLTDRTLQMVLPMYVTDITDAAKEDNVAAEVFAPLLSSAGVGTQTYEKGSFGKPSITPFIEQVLGTQLPTTTFGR